MKPVAGASNTQSRSSASRCACIAAAVVIFFFFATMAGSNSSGDSLRSGQAMHTTTLPAGVPSGSSYSSGAETSYGNFDGDATDSFGEVSETTSSTTYSAPGVDTPPAASGMTTGGYSEPQVVEDVEGEVEEEVQKEESQLEILMKQQIANRQESLTAALNNASTGMRQNLKILLGSVGIFSSSEITTLTDEIIVKYNSNVTAYIKEQSEALLEKEEVELEVEADLEVDGVVEGEVDAEETMDEIKEEESVVEDDLAAGINKILNYVEQNARKMLGAVAKDMLKKALKTKTGHSYSVYVDEDGTVTKFKQKTKKKTTTKSASTTDSNFLYGSVTTGGSSVSGAYSSPMSAPPPPTPTYGGYGTNEGTGMGAPAPTDPVETEGDSEGADFDEGGGEEDFDEGEGY